MDVKKCDVCNKLLPFQEFYFYSKNHDVVQNFCKKCSNVRRSLLRDKYRSVNLTKNYKLDKNLLKTCCCCNRVKKVHNFQKDITSKDGYRSNCKCCRNKKRREIYNKSHYPILDERKNNKLQHYPMKKPLFQRIIDWFKVA